MEVLHTWGPDIFHLSEVANGSPLTPVTYTILKVCVLRAVHMYSNCLSERIDCVARNTAHNYTHMDCCREG